VLEPAVGWRLPDLKEAWTHRDLLYFLVRRDVVVRYKQAVIGVLWAVLQPVLLAGVFAVFFGLLAKVPSETGVPYPLFVLTGMIVWLSFSKAVELGAASLVSNEQLISKIYCPRIIIPVAAIIPPWIDFAIGFVVTICVGLAYGFVPSIGILAAPVFVLLAMFTAFGAGLWLAALNVRYRDISVVVPFVLLVGLFITPIVYPFDLVPNELQPLYAINPMVGVLEGFRWSLLGADWPGFLLLIPVAVSAVLVLGGALYFRRAERSFADVI